MFELNNLRLELSGKCILDFENNRLKIDSKDKVAILGENGAGKTSLLNTLLGEYRLTKGSVKCFYEKKDIGVVFQNNYYDGLIKVTELIHLVFPNWNRRKVAHFLDMFSLTKIKGSYIKELSTGEIQRLTLGLVLSQKKKVYFFDELTSGLDALKREYLLALMKEKTYDATVLNVTHYFEEIENWATKILIIKKGKIVYWGSRKKLLGRFKAVCAYKTQNNLNLKNVNSVKIGNEFIYIAKDQNESDRIKRKLFNKEFTMINPGIYVSYLLAYF